MSNERKVERSSIKQIVVGSLWESRRPNVDGTRRTVVVEGMRGTWVSARDLDTGEIGGRTKIGLVAGYRYAGMASASHGVDDVTMVAMKVSPDVARRWLELYSPKKYNRDINERHVDKLVEEILGDRFKCTPQPIIFTTDSKLSDGQHRLTAIERANTSTWLRVSFHKNSAVAKEVVAGTPPPEVCRDDVGAPLDLGMHRPAYVIQGLNGDRNFGFERRVQSIVHAIDHFNGKNITKPMPGHVDAVVSEYKGGIEWAASALQHSIPVVGAAAFAIAYQRKSSREKVEELASIISTKAWHNDPTRGAAAATLDEMRIGTTRVVAERKKAILRILRLIAAYCQGVKPQRVNTKNFNADYFLKAA